MRERMRKKRERKSEREDGEEKERGVIERRSDREKE